MWLSYLFKGSPVYTLQQTEVLDQMKANMLTQMSLILALLLLILHIALYVCNIREIISLPYLYNLIFIVIMLILSYFFSQQKHLNLSIHCLSITFYGIIILQIHVVPQLILTIFPLVWIALLIACFSYHYFTLIIHLVIAVISFIFLKLVNFYPAVTTQLATPVVLSFVTYYLFACLLLFYYLHKITEMYLINLSKQRRKAQKEYFKAEQAHTNKEQFLANMSHELRTPLNAILGYTDYHLESFDLGLFDELNHAETLEIKKQLSVIQQGGHQLLKLVDDLLQLSQLSAETESLSLRVLQPEMIQQYLEKQPIHTRLTPLIPKIKIQGELSQDFTNELKYLCRLSRLLCHQLYHYNLDADPHVILNGEDDTLIIQIYDASHLQTSVLDSLAQQEIPVADLLATQNEQQGFLVCLKLCELLEIQMTVETDDERTRFYLEVPSLKKYKVN